MSKILSTLFCLNVVMPCATFASEVSTPSHNSICPEVAFKSENTTWSGHYYLNGIREVGSELLLQNDGHFKWMFAYGNMDAYAEGHWWKNANCIGLKADRKFKKSASLLPNRLEINNSSLDVIWPNGEQRGTFTR